MISLKKSSWHYKLIKWCWNINPEEFKNLCPYFWLTIASLFLVIPITVWRVPIRLIQKGLGELDIKRYERWIRSLDDNDIAYCKTNDFYTEYQIRISYPGKIEIWRSKIVRDWENLTGRSAKGLVFKKPEEKKKKDLTLIIQGTKKVSIFLLTCILTALGYIVSNAFVVLGIYITNYKSTFFIPLGVILLFILICWIIRNFIPKKVLYYIFFPIIIIAKGVWWILTGISEGLIEGFKEFGGIFRDYLNSSYSDYCPGINWEEEKEEKK